jgi:hypothetical protein
MNALLRSDCDLKAVEVTVRRKKYSFDELRLP